MSLINSAKQMSGTELSNYYVVYAEPLISKENGLVTSMYQVPVSNRHHSSIESAKQEYDELSAKLGKLLGLVESIGPRKKFFVEFLSKK